MTTYRCHYCKGLPDSHEVDKAGKCAACGGSGVHPEGDDPHDDGEGWDGADCDVCRVHCDGCDEHRTDVLPYLVTHHDDTASDAAYCHDCAALARCDWNGETKSIVLKTT